jgi:hypothetical protein
MTRAVGSPAPGTIEDRGTVSGPPFRRGTVDLLAKFEGSEVTGTFEIDTARGSAHGAVSMTYIITGSEITFRGTADFTGGTGRYRGIRGRNLRAYDHNTLDGQNGTFTLHGFARY